MTPLQQPAFWVLIGAGFFTFMVSSLLQLTRRGSKQGWVILIAMTFLMAMTVASAVIFVLTQACS